MFKIIQQTSNQHALTNCMLTGDPDIVGIYMVRNVPIKFAYSELYSKDTIATNLNQRIYFSFPLDEKIDIKKPNSPPAYLKKVIYNDLIGLIMLKENS